ncbi:hypothetical protein QYF36_023691 [Acer negundo]|nr:hypothetical protein QYF36_023691 [Acer negundo]
MVVAQARSSKRPGVDSQEAMNLPNSCKVLMDTILEGVVKGKERLEINLLADFVGIDKDKSREKGRMEAVDSLEIIGDVPKPNIFKFSSHREEGHVGNKKGGHNLGSIDYVGHGEENGGSSLPIRPKEGEILKQTQKNGRWKRVNRNECALTVDQGKRSSLRKRFSSEQDTFYQILSKKSKGSLKPAGDQDSLLVDSGVCLATDHATLYVSDNLDAVVSDGKLLGDEFSEPV